MASEGVAHKALIKNSSKFKESGLDPKKLAVVLYKKELITPEAYAKTTDSKSTASDEEKLEILYNDIDENTLVKDGYFDHFLNCLMNDIKDERCTAVAQSIKSSYENMVAQRQDITVGVKNRFSDAAKFMKKKAAQAHEGFRTVSYAVGDFIAKDKVEEENDLDDSQNEEDESQKEDVKSEDESPDAYRCLSCSKTITQEEEPVHRACLPDYPLCIRCLQNEKKDSSYYCEQCLEYEQVSICHYCSGETNGIPVHISCLENYPWCLRCMTQKREGAKYLCKECKPENFEANVCLQCLEPVNSEEEPVHKNCLPHYPLCIRCLTNKRSDPSHYCAHCLIYDQVSICYHCSGPTNGSPVHFLCLKHYAWCLRCLSQQRDHPKLLCTDCEETNHEQENCLGSIESVAHVSAAEATVDELMAENQNENLIIPETEVNVINPVLNDLEQGNQLNVFPESPTIGIMSPCLEQHGQDNQLNVFPGSPTIGNGCSADLDLAIKNGHTIKVRWSTLCISGPSGSGKSSLIKLLLGKEPLLTYTSTSVLGTIESHGVALLLITDDINCTWEEIQDIKGLLCEAVRSGAITPSPFGGGRFDFSLNETLPHSFSYVSHNEVSSKAITSPVSPIVEDMRCLLQKHIVSHFVNAPPTYHFVSIIDTGGHEAFFDIAPALHCYGLANIVTHKLDEILSSKAFSFYCVKDEIMGEIEARQLTNQQYVVSSVRSSTSINPPQISGLETQLQKFQSQIIVGTFSAEINQIETLMTKNNILRANTINCEHVVSYDGKNLIFPINATARDDHHSQIATKIRKHVCESYIEADIPLKWFVFLLHLQELCIGLCILKKADCIEIGSSLQMTENEVEAALLYFCDIKMILYWPDALPTQIVFLQPQYLYNKITQLVLASFPNSHEYFENKGIELHPVAYAEYRDKGIFSLELLHSICGPFDNEDFTSMELLQLLKNLAVIVEIPNFYGDGIHFFPSILPVLPTDSDDFEILQKKYMEELEPLILSWPTGINPQGLFPALIVKLLNGSQPRLFNLKPECRQYRNAIQLEYVAYRGSVLLVDAVYNVEVFYDSERRSKFDKWISSHVRESIFDRIGSIVNQFHYNDRLANPVKKFVCLKHSEYTKHYCEIKDNNRLSCERDQSPMDISEFKQNPWLQETNLDISNLIYLLRLLKEFTIHWNRLGLALGLTLGTIDIIDHDCRSRSEDCFRICLQKWLQKADNVHTVTWVSLAEALFLFNDITAPPTGWVNQF